MLGKRVIKFERLKIRLNFMFRQDWFSQTWSHIGYRCIVIFFSYHINILIFQYRPALHECLVKNIIKDNRTVTPYISVSTLTV